MAVESAELASLRAQVRELASFPPSDPAAAVRLGLILAGIVQELEAIEARAELPPSIPSVPGDGGPTQPNITVGKSAAGVYYWRVQVFADKSDLPTLQAAAAVALEIEQDLDRTYPPEDDPQ